MPGELLQQRDSKQVSTSLLGVSFGHHTGFLRTPAKVAAVVYMVAGAVACFTNLLRPDSHDVGRFLLYLLCANLAVLCLRLTAGRTLLSAGFLVLLLGMRDLTLSELLFIACTVTLLGELERQRGKLKPLPLLFAIASVNVGIASAQLAYRSVGHFTFGGLFPAPVIAGSFVLLFNYGVARTLLTEGAAPMAGLYRHECRPLLPWFVAAAYLAYLIGEASAHSGVNAAVLALPVLFTLDRGYRAWSGTRESHAAELALLHRRTLETLSVVINARDRTADQHLRRVQFYAKAIGEELGLNHIEMDDLRVAAMVYNIGHLGVPDHILLKPGTLTSEELEKVRTHPHTGAEMLLRMSFPAGVVSVVKAHHEKWNGSGYPAGLRGAEIPMGARILAAIDCLDALASPRPFRDALPLDDAMKQVSSEAGNSFDPAVVEVLARRYRELERGMLTLANHSTAGEPARGNESTDLVRRISLEPGLEQDSIVDPIVSAREETQLLRVLAGETAQSLRCDEIAAASHKCLSGLVRHDTLVLYVQRAGRLQVAGTMGRSGHRFRREPVAASGGPSGRALLDGIPVLNGDASQERAFQQEPLVHHPLQSALAMPLEGASGAFVGVLTLYHITRDAFTRDHLRLVKAVGGCVGAAVESALKYEAVENLAGTDHLTGIANARSFGLHLERELARASRDNSSIGLLLCDLNGFKQVNDRFGHLKGNQVLQEVARGLRETCRSSDYFARLGGDEFVVVVPGLHDDMCPSYLQRIQSIAVEAGWTVCGEACLSASVGISIYPRDGRDSETLLRRADERMYHAKELFKADPFKTSDGSNAFNAGA